MKRGKGEKDKEQSKDGEGTAESGERKKLGLYVLYVLCVLSDHRASLVSWACEMMSCRAIRLGRAAAWWRDGVGRVP